MEPSQNHTSHQGRDSQGVGCFTNNVVGHMGCCMDGMCPESWGGDIPSVKKAKMSVPLQPSCGCVMFRITDPTLSLSPPETFRRRIVDHQYYQSYAPYFRPDNSRLGPSPPAPYHMQNHSYPILGTSLVNGLRPTHASLFSISDYGYARSRYHMIQFTSPHVYSFHHMLVSYYHAVLCI